MKISLFLTTLMYCGITNAQLIVNSSFESWGVSGCETNFPPDNWLEYSNGIGVGVDEANFFICPTTIPPSAADGSIYARASATSDTTGEGMYQDVTNFIVGELYQITFDFAGSNLYSGNNDVQWHLFIDDVDVDQTPVFSSSDSSWSTHSYTFTATNSIHKIGFRAYATTLSGPGSVAIDNVTLKNTANINNSASRREFSISPNPFSSWTVLNASKSLQNATLIIYNSSGEAVKHLTDISGQVFTINRDQLVNGLYLVRLIVDQRAVFVEKIIIY